MLLRGAGLGRGDEAGADPYTLGTEHKGGGKTATVVNTASSDDMDLRLSERG